MVDNSNSWEQKCIQIERFVHNYQITEAIELANETLAIVFLPPEIRAGIIHLMMCLYADIAPDGTKAREKAVELLTFLDKNNVIEKVSSQWRKRLEEMYVAACDVMCDFALSYQEFEEYSVKVKTVQNTHTVEQKNNIQQIEDMKKQGYPWTINMIQLADNCAGVTEFGKSSTMFGKAAAIYGLILTESRTLRPSREEMQHAAYNYAIYSGNVVEMALQHWKRMSTPTHSNHFRNYHYIFDHAKKILEENRKNVGNDEIVDKGLALLEKRSRDLANGIKKTARLFTLMTILSAGGAATVWYLMISENQWGTGKILLSLILLLFALSTYRNSRMLRKSSRTMR
ncbi:MAG: hypothetical protein LBR26_12795 [Prevotella sp.]|jgi:hypothetical protein|nr:hypothetical protein [Prevotella sp.]